MRPYRQDEERSGSGMADLKKMFSSHVQENVVLRRQKSELDFAKMKKMRELNHDESLFLRKYEKYAMVSGRRRNSVDVGSLRRPSSRVEEDVGPQKALGRMAVVNECPYSLDTWSKFTDVDKKFLDENRNTILSSSVCETREDDMVTPVSPRKIGPLLVNRERSANVVRRNSLTPLDAKYEEEEIFQIQRANKPRPRRHSLHPLSVMPKAPALQNRRRSVDAGLPFPSIGQDFRTSYGSKSSSNPDVSADTVDGPGKPTQKQKKSVSTVPSFQDSLSDISEKKSDHLSDDHEQALDEHENISPRAILKKSPLLAKKNDQIPVPKPIANATVFIRDEDGHSERVSANKCIGSTVNVENCGSCEETIAKDNTSLPAISKNPTLIGTPDIKHVKTVTFHETLNTDPTGSDTNGNGKPSELKSRKKFRRYSTGVIALQHMIDSVHGASKLKYIDQLASEMQREAGIEDASPEEDNTLQQLQNCRYLRVSSQPVDDDPDLWNFRGVR